MNLKTLLEKKYSYKDTGIQELIKELGVGSSYDNVLKTERLKDKQLNKKLLKLIQIFIQMMGNYSVLTNFYFNDIKKQEDGDLNQATLHLRKDISKLKKIQAAYNAYEKFRKILIDAKNKDEPLLANNYKLATKAGNKKANDYTLFQQFYGKLNLFLNMTPKITDKVKLSLIRASDKNFKLEKSLVESLKQINKKQILTEKAMLDISIKNVDKVATNDSKIKTFLSTEYKVEEKFDGTKLTLWRNDAPWDEDYEKNWVVAFKNQILYGGEFETVDLEKVKKHSVGISQYAFVHKHMKNIHKDTKSFPKNTEVFIEFIQNKLTTTRDYENKHGLYIIAHSPATGEIEGGMLKTRATGFYQDKVEEFSRMLSLNLPPVVFEGKLDSVSNITKGIKNAKLKTVWNKNKTNYEANPYDTVKQTFLEFESVLGGKTEGVVLHASNGDIFKFVQDDQYDKHVRFAKKMKYQADTAIEKEYWNTIKELSTELLKDVDYSLNKLSYQDILKAFSKKVNSMTDKEIEKKFKFKFDAMKAEGKMK